MHMYNVNLVEEIKKKSLLSTLVCANLAGKSFGRFTCFDLRSTFTDAVHWSVQLFLAILSLTGKTFIFKDAG